MHNTQHIAETFEADTETGDWQMRQKFPEDTFPNVIQHPALKRTLEAWQAGRDSDEALAAVVDVSDPRPGGYRILHHRNPQAMGHPSEGLELYQVEGQWSRHAERLAEEYREAKENGITCYAISQNIDGTERRYHRIIKRRGEVLLVASAPFERE